ncbi:major facilitator superfamily domain-containing protein [Fusarium flagelliforme]|uniref:major facilitator superfamily domain-containing protein n=1 Tax=Fusarium flagelliforme TaxID=2675880 RepID=UPI001E8DB266|nr:major facilitator superfamily domain-containing protein [Fusarium flagelliforme]KAH7192191.1 major facilitator superfamily domain-containing protein [Fusarium flagelliforme]
MPSKYQPVASEDVELESHLDAPLLDLDPLEDDATSSNANGIFHAQAEPVPSYRFSRWGVHSPKRIVILVSIIKFVVVFSGMLLMLPTARLIEDMFCHIHYKDTSTDIIDEMKCKVDEVQSQLGYLFGWTGLITSLVGLVVAFPYGTMSDKIGRKPTLMFSWVGIAVCYLFAPFSIKAFQGSLRDRPYMLVLGGFFQIFGGGIPVLMSTLYSIAADVSTEENKAKHFLWSAFGATAGGISGPAVAGILMNKYGPWLPIYLVLIFVPIVMGILVLLPETLTINVKKQQAGKKSPSTLKEHISHGVKDLKHSLNMLKNVSVAMILITFFIQTARYTAYTTTMSQYISKHFKWKMADVSLILSPLGILDLTILAGLPKVGDRLMSSPRFRMTAFGKDLFLTRVSTVMLVFGAFWQGLSHNVGMFFFGVFIETWGAATGPLARATVTHYVQPEYTARLYALIGMIEVIGSFIAGPVLAWFFDLGLKKKGIWIGLPWFYVSFLCAVALAALYLVKPPVKRAREDVVDNEGYETDDYMPDDPLRLR